jgi:uncharacterized protein
LHLRPPADLSLRLAVAERLGLRLVGLAGLPALDRGLGLLIPRCSCVHTFGMRFSIDVVFLGLAAGGRTGHVLAVRECVRPARLARARGRGLAAIELVAWEARRLGLRPGVALVLER